MRVNEAGAKWIHDDLVRHNILTEAMEANPHFGLRIVGHSLGAGVAAMLGLMLRQQFPNLYCLCFSPPGCVFSEKTARKSKDYACSVSWMLIRNIHQLIQNKGLLCYFHAQNLHLTM